MTKLNDEKIISEMPGRVARWEDLKGFLGGHPDSGYEGYDRTLYNVIGFGSPEDATDENAEDADAYVSSPVGSISSANTAIEINEGLNVGFLEAEPNNGVGYHSHDTNESFVVLDGTWRFFWGENEGESVDLDPRDSISFPAPAERRFVNISDAKGTLLVMIAGDQPRAIWNPENVKELRENSEKIR